MIKKLYVYFKDWIKVFFFRNNEKKYFIFSMNR